MQFLRPVSIVAIMTTAALFAAGCPPPDDSGDAAADGNEPGDTAPEDLAEDVETGPPYDEGCGAADIPKLALETVFKKDQLNEAVHLAQAPGDPETYYIVQRPGQIVVSRSGSIRSTPFLDISDQVVSGYGEQGLLGLAFHPDYAENGRFFVAYTQKGDWKNVIAEYERSASNEYRANPNEVRRLVDIDDPKKQHNGGTLIFGPDGYLYATLGNGGAHQKRKQGVGLAQLTDNVFGTIMRMDVDRPGRNFAAPNNPFADGGGDGRIFAWGLRNTWRISIDPKTGDLYAGDVGKKSWEEIDYIPAESDGGQNFGWPAYLGSHEGPVTSAKEAIDEHTEPIFEYRYKSGKPDIRGGCSVIGGRVYRGSAIPELDGYFIYGDLCTNDLAAIRYCDTKDADAEPELVDSLRLPGIQTPWGLTAVHAEADGELLLVFKGGQVKRLVEAN